MSTEGASTTLVIAGVDGSEDGLRAARFAAGQAKVRGADLLILHAVDDAAVAGAWGVVYDPTALQEAGQVVVDEARAVAIDGGLDESRVKGEVVLGNPAAILADRSATADLIVVGRRATSGLQRMFVGSTSVAVSGMATCPVMIISQAANPSPVGDKHRVAVAVGPQSTGTKALCFGFQQAQLYESELVVVTVAPSMPAGATGGYKLTDESMKHVIDEADRRLSEVIGPLTAQFPTVSVSQKVLTGQPVDELVNLSAEVDELVVGMKKHPILGWTPGGVTRGIMAHARCPLAIVH
ncbi:universal stress protein [Acidipropionibacterium timonense]|uniref:universal stress protein n=1 Tax=Acidipropionibacterium timonense TaxID=2161818 RepID=UPI00103045A4|nr:universal stress protein [Acidipropionibacterium timonense]